MIHNLSLRLKITLLSKLLYSQLPKKFRNTFQKWFSSDADGIGKLGSGAGKGGGAGGKVREAGGAMGVRGAVQEEEYFHKLKQQQIEELKQKLEEENAEHEKRIQEIKENAERNSADLDKLNDLNKKFKK